MHYYIYIFLLTCLSSALSAEQIRLPEMPQNGFGNGLIEVKYSETILPGTYPLYVTQHFSGPRQNSTYVVFKASDAVSVEQVWTAVLAKYNPGSQIQEGEARHAKVEVGGSAAFISVFPSQSIEPIKCVYVLFKDSQTYPGDNARFVASPAP